MIKGDKGKMPITMLDKLYFSQRRAKEARIKRRTIAEDVKRGFCKIIPKTEK